MKIRTLLVALVITAFTMTTTMAFAQDATATPSTQSGQKQYVPLPNDSTLGPGAPLMKGLADHGMDANLYLAKLVHDSLQRDSSGNSKLDAAQCLKDGSCATPNDYLYLIKKHHAPSGLTDVSQLERYVSGLSKTLVVDGSQYYSARMIGDKVDDTSGFHRASAKGEYIYEDTQTGEDIFFENCGNVIWPVPLKELTVPAAKTCIPIDYVVPEGTTEVSFEIGGPTAMAPSSCFGLQQPGTMWTVLPTHCPSMAEACSFRMAEANVSHDVDIEWHFGGGYVPVAPGTHTIRLPLAATQGYVLFVCLKGVDPTTGKAFVGASHIYFHHLTDQLPPNGGHFSMGIVDKVLNQ